jgi:hypothetical protein
MSENTEIEKIDEVIEQINDIGIKLKEFKEVAKSLKKEKAKKEKKEKKDGEEKKKIKRIKEDIKLFRGGLNLYQYKENAIEAGFQNPPEFLLKDIIKDLYEKKPKKNKKSLIKKNDNKVNESN